MHGDLDRLLDEVQEAAHGADPAIAADGALVADAVIDPGAVVDEPVPSELPPTG